MVYYREPAPDYLKPMRRQVVKHLNKVVMAALFLSPMALQAAESKQVTPSIVGGVESTPYSRPYQVALLMNGRQGCGGTLISPNWVLTAAHCVDSASTSSLTVQVGAHSISRRDGQNVRVSQIIRHENWQGAQGIRSGWDIAVLKLASPVSASIKPAKLPSVRLAEELAPVGRPVTVSGWGLTRNQGSPSDVLREVNLPVLSNQACSSELRFNLPASVICGGGTGGVSACNGDSGGPFAVAANGNFYSIGTVSWGNACVGATAFTRTSSFLNWIAQKTGVVADDGSGGGVDQKPVAAFSTNVVGLNVSFKDGSSDDKGVAKWAWDFGDNSGSSEQSPSHAYAKAGTYNVSLVVTDSAGQTNSVAQLVKVGGDTGGTCNGVSPWSSSTTYKVLDVVSYAGKKYQAAWWSANARPDIYSNVWSLIGPCQ